LIFKFLNILISALLEVADDLELALKAVPKDDGALESSHALKTLVQGSISILESSRVLISVLKVLK
jgi:molecular chaperone GrpE (heat shock protein)